MRWSLVFIASAAFAGDFTTYIGVSYPYSVSAITGDSASNTYVVGTRNLGTLTDVFLTKLDPTGKILFTKTFGGSAPSAGNAVVVDSTGNIYIAGSTSASDFPLSKALQTQSAIYNGETGFIVKLSNDGTTILYSTYFGGAQGPSYISALTTDAKGNLYLTGSSSASDFPQTSGMPIATLRASLAGISGAIVAEISAAGDKILYSGAIAGTVLACLVPDPECFDFMPRSTAGVGIALDGAGNVYIAGSTDTYDLPVTLGVLAPKGLGAFVGKIAPGGAGLSYLTYLDSNGQLSDVSDIGAGVNAIAVDALGNAYLAGSTNDPGFPATPGTFQPTFVNGQQNPPTATSPYAAFLAKLNPSGTAMVWASFLGGTGNAIGRTVAIDSSQNVWASGTTTSPNFPSSQGTGGDFLVEASSSGSSLLYSSRFPSGTVSQALAIDPAGSLHIAGLTGIVSLFVPGAKPAISIFGIQNAFGGSLSGQISPAEVISIYGQQIGPVAPVAAAPANGFYPTTLGGVEVSINGIDIPLLYVSSTQINAVVPMSAVSGAMQVTYGSASASFPIQTVSSTATAYPAVLNQDGTINSESNPAKAGSIVTFYATGFQTNFYPLADGQVATAAENYCAFTCPGNPSTATIVYAGAAPGIVAGVTQFNVSLPATAGSFVDLYPLGSLNGQPVAVWVSP